MILIANRNLSVKFTDKHLRLFRNLRKIKQPALVFKLGVKQQAVSKMENKDCILSEKADEYLQAPGFKREEALRLLELMSLPETN